MLNTLVISASRRGTTKPLRKSCKHYVLLNPGVNSHFGLFLYFARRHEQAIEVLQKSLELGKNLTFTHTVFGYNYAAMGRWREAIAAYRLSFTVLTAIQRRLRGILQTFQFRRCIKNYQLEGMRSYKA